MKERQAEQSKHKPGSPFITPERLRELHGRMLQLACAERDFALLFRKRGWPNRQRPAVEHPAVLAGCFGHLRPGDTVAPANCCFAANLVAGVPLAAAVRLVAEQAMGSTAPRRATAKAGPAAGLAMLAGYALAQKAAGKGQAVVAMVPERELLEAGSAEAMRQIAARNLPLLLVSVGHALPEPGEPQNCHGVQRITVGADDVVGIYRVMQESMHRARTGIGATWIYCSLAMVPRAANPAKAALSTMKHFLELRGLYDAGQPGQEQSRWAAEWKAALKALRSAGDSETEPGLPVSCIDLLR